MLSVLFFWFLVICSKYFLVVMFALVLLVPSPVDTLRASLLLTVTLLTLNPLPMV